MAERLAVVVYALGWVMASLCSLALLCGILSTWFLRGSPNEALDKLRGTWRPFPFFFYGWWAVVGWAIVYVLGGA